MTRIILITGATGKQGGAALTRLLELAPSDTKFRALTRNTTSGAAKSLSNKGVEVVKGDLLDRASLTSAFECVDTAFLVTLPNTSDNAVEVQQGKNFVDAAKEAKVSHVVFTSVEGADRAPDVPHFASKHEIEKEIHAAGFPTTTILRPVAFMDNYPVEGGFLRFMVLGMFATMLDGKPLQVISVKDIGYVAAEAMVGSDKFTGKEVGLAGDELTLQQVLEVYSKVLYKGKQTPWKALIPWFLIKMMPHDFQMMGKFFREKGYTVDIPALRDAYPNLQNFEAFLEEKTGKKTN